MERAQEYLNVFVEIERELRRRTQERTAGFRALLDALRPRDRVVAHYFDALVDHSELRNALVHRRGPDNEPIADPYPATLANLMKIRDTLCAPARVSQLGTAQPLTCHGKDVLSVVGPLMRDNDYSQLPVVNDAGHVVGILASEDIAHWWIAHPRDPGDPCIADIISAHDTEHRWRALAPEADALQALAAFEQGARAGVSLRAVLVTDKGRADARPQRIITVADLPAVLALFQL